MVMKDTLQNISNDESESCLQQPQPGSKCQTAFLMAAKSSQWQQEEFSVTDAVDKAKHTVSREHAESLLDLESERIPASPAFNQPSDCMSSTTPVVDLQGNESLNSKAVGVPGTSNFGVNQNSLDLVKLQSLPTSQDSSRPSISNMVKLIDESSI